jgi:CubicO group peptidase (beta-lactamase class C family)
MRINRKVVAYSIFSVVLLTLVFAALFRTQVRQFYHTVRLFDEDVIVNNFSNMDSIAPTITIERSGQVSPFGHRALALPDSFVYKNESRSMTDFLQDSSTTALLVVRGNDIVFEEYYQGTGEFDQRISWSMAKSFLSAIFGVAVNDGLIPDLNQAVTDYVPELKGSGYDGVSIKNVLQMSTGVYFNEDYGDFHSDINRMGRLMALGGSFDDFAASLNREREQGTYLHYVSINTHVLGMVLRAATGRSIADYFDEKLWSRLDTERDAIYISDSTGEPMVLGGLNLITRDYARFGRLYRDRGIMDGEQIIPADWIEDSITPDAPHLMPGVRDNSDTDLGYGYQWWIPQQADGEFMAIGIYGQYIYVNRKADVVIVKNSAHRGFMDNNYESKDITVAAFRAITREMSIN